MALFDAAQLSWPKVQSLATSGAVALIPIGSTEAHGPHLPLSVDVIIAEAVCARLATVTRSELVRFPAVAYGLTDFAAPFAGTVTLESATALSMLTEIFQGVAQAGFTRVGIVNHHLEPAHFKLVHAAQKAAQATAGASRLVVVDHRRAPTGPSLGDEFMHGGSHAGCYETSLMLAAAPHLVDEPARRALHDVEVNLPAVIKAGAKNFHEAGGPMAYFGTPARATAEEGERLFSLLVEATRVALELEP